VETIVVVKTDYIMQAVKSVQSDVTDIAEIAELAESYLPGQVYDADDQCYIAFGSKACSEVSE